MRDKPDPGGIAFGPIATKAYLETGQFLGSMSQKVSGFICYLLDPVFGKLALKIILMLSQFL